jgi:hypothetical protein
MITVNDIYFVVNLGVIIFHSSHISQVTNSTTTVTVNNRIHFLEPVRIEALALAGG